MRDHQQHISDEELLLATDREGGRRADRARTHLEACYRCRLRAAQMKSALVELARAQRDTAELPSIAVPHALLRTRLAELSTGKVSTFARVRIFGRFLAGAPALAIVAAVMIAAAYLVFRHPTATDTALARLSPDHDVLPNHAFTPGTARQASLGEVCSFSHEEVVAPVSPSERQRVFAEYGIPTAQSGSYEVDYLITPGLGGQDDIRNLWPEPYNAAQWNAHAKDALEERLHEMVCSHQLDLSVAQEAIAQNWIAAYQKYVQPAPSKRRDLKTAWLRRS